MHVQTVAALALAISAVLVTTRASASAPPAAEPRNVVVTATRVPQPAAEVLAPIVVIDREAIERALSTDLADLLRWHAGLEVGRTGGPGQATSLFIRGTNSNHALVLVDGVRINPGTLGGAAVQNVVPELVERIEVVKGPRSTLYGTDAIGGVVNVITRRDGPDGLQALVGYGRWDSRQALVRGKLGGDAGELALAASLVDSDGFPTRATDDVARGFRNRSLALSGRTTLGAVELGARWWRADGNTEYSDFFLTPVDQDFRNEVVATHAAWQPTGLWNTRVTLSRTTDELAQRQSPDSVTTRRDALDWQNGLELGRHRLTLGALLTREEVDTLSFGAGFDVDTRADTFYLQDQFDAGRHSLLLAAGWTDHEDFGGHGTWNVEYGLRLGRGTLLTAAAGTAFRAPDATNRYGFGGNPDLDPERSRNLELGVRQRLGTGHVLALAAFENRIDDLVQFVTLSFEPFVGRNLNVDRARIRGLEASWEYADADWRVRAEAFLQDPRDLDTDARLLRRARENYTFAIARAIGPHELGIDLLAAGDRRDFGFPAAVRLGGYVLANLTARVALTPAWQVQARLENATDRRYELARGFNTMGRALFVATRWEFR